MIMKNSRGLKLAAIVVLAASSISPALAGTVSPADQDFTATDTLSTYFEKGSFNVTCTLILPGTTGSDIGGDRAAGGITDKGTNTGSPACLALEVDPTGFVMDPLDTTSPYSGTMNHVVVRNISNSTILCDDVNVPFEIDTSGVITLQTNIAAPIGDPDVCFVDTVLTASNGVVGAP